MLCSQVLSSVCFSCRTSGHHKQRTPSPHMSQMQAASRSSARGASSGYCVWCFTQNLSPFSWSSWRLAINNCNSVSSVVETIVVGVDRLSISSDSSLKRFIGTFGGCVPIVDSAEVGKANNVEKVCLNIFQLLDLFVLVNWNIFSVTVTVTVIYYFSVTVNVTVNWALFFSYFAISVTVNLNNVQWDILLKSFIVQLYNIT